MRIKPSRCPEEANPEGARIERDHVLKWASELTVEKANPDAVIANANVLLDWMATQDAADRDARYKALSRAHHNRGWDRDRDDDPAKLIAEAEVFYAFLKVG
jgi:hypothetical protein